MDILFLVVLIVVMFGMMFWQSKKAKQQQAERQDFRSNLQPGTEASSARSFPSIRNTRRSSLIPKDRNCVSASTPSAVNMSVRHTCMMMRSMRTAIRYPRKTSPTRSLSSTRLKSPHRMPMLFSSPLTSRRTIDFFDF